MCAVRLSAALIVRAKHIVPLPPLSANVSTCPPPPLFEHFCQCSQSLPNLDL